VTVSRDMRHTKANRCPVCDGADGDPRGKEKRCHGFTSEDGYCHCSREELAGAIEVGSDGLYSHKLHGSCRCGVVHGEVPSGTMRAAPANDIEATYDYTDERGTLLFQVVRRTGKRFVQRRPNGSDWIWQTSGVRRVLYRLPQILAASPERVIHVCEGEKDVETLERAGYLATCNPGGAGKWKFVANEAVEALRGRVVVVVADADKAGREHAKDVSEALQGAAKSVRIVEAPSPHKDASDVVAAGGDLAAMLAEPKVDDGWGFVDVDELAADLPPIPWLCESLRLAPGPLNMFAGYGYSRKTLALQSLGVAVAAGKDVWGVFGCRKGPVLHLDYEQGRRLTQERYQRLARGMGFDLRDLAKGSLRVACMPKRYLFEQSDVDSLMPYAEGAALVLVDSLQPAFRGADENSSDVRKHLDELSRLSERTGACIVIIHHAGKPPGEGTARKAKHAPRGSSAIFDACQGVFVFEGEKGQPTLVQHEKERISGRNLESFGLDAYDTEDKRGLIVCHLEAEQLNERKGERERAKHAADLAACEKTVVEFLSRRPFSGSIDELRAATETNRSLIYRVMAQLQQNERVKRSGKKGSLVWTLA